MEQNDGDSVWQGHLLTFAAHLLQNTEAGRNWGLHIPFVITPWPNFLPPGLKDPTAP